MTNSSTQPQQPAQGEPAEIKLARIWLKSRDIDDWEMLSKFRNDGSYEHTLLAALQLFPQLIRHIDRLIAENAALRNDKERLDWLEDAGDPNPRTAHEISRHKGYFQAWDGSRWGEMYKTLREAIDAALAPT